MFDGLGRVVVFQWTRLTLFVHSGQPNDPLAKRGQDVVLETANPGEVKDKTFLEKADIFSSFTFTAQHTGSCSTPAYFQLSQLS